MNSKRLVAALMTALLAVALPAAGGLAAPRQPTVLPTVGDTIAAPYDAVWDATLKSLGIVKVLAADKAAGRIETETFPFVYIVGGSNHGNTQVIWVDLRITMSRAADNATLVQVEPRIHDSLLNGFTPGPTNNPWLDLFAKIRTRLSTRG
jgi:hypothetical protein